MNHLNININKNIIIGIPIAFFMALLIGVAIIINNKAELKTTTKEEKFSSNEIVGPLVEMDETKPGYISNNKYINSFIDMKNKKKIDNTIIYYAHQFNLDAKKVTDLARELSSNYESDSVKNQNAIVASDGEFKSLEAGIVYFVRYLYRNPESYGTTGREIGLNSSVRVASRKENGHIMLNNGMTYEQFLAKICDLYGINKTLALAIVYEESGKMTSTLFTRSNNMGGLRGGSGWLAFPSLEAGTICYVFTLKNLLRGLDSFQTSSVYALSGIYVHGNASDPAPEWTGKVLNYMNIIEANKVFE